jgi:primosomal protein N' (replication factor Y)
MKFAHVAVNTPFNNSILTYSYNEEELTPKVGSLVQVPLGKRLERGCVIELLENYDSEGIDLKGIDSFYDQNLDFNQSTIELYAWIANYYHYPLGKLIFDVLPKSLKRPRALESVVGEGHDIDFSLTETQQDVVAKLSEQIDEGFFSALVHGITGSGKSIIYLEMMKKVLSKGQSVLFILPEINLTPQFLKIFSRYLNVPIYSYHSSVSNSNRYALWKLVQEDQTPKLIVGVRSSIFLPIENLGLIIVDEEHDSSFKQEDRCKYNARDVALKIGHAKNIGVVLGSATPSLETYHRYKNEGHGLYLSMKERPGESYLPEIVCLDERSSWEDKYTTFPFQPDSFKAIDEAFAKGEQVLVFVNRLGYSAYLQCHSCGHIFQCPNCSSNLKFFQSRSQVDCYICGYQDRAPNICPECSNLNIIHKGYGTEKLAGVLEQKYPDKVVGRFDRDEVKTFNDLNKTLDDFADGKIDILVGTQMLSKGHNFEKVNLVLVFGLDSFLSFPDFRANERVYQQLTQISGRAGRYHHESKVLIHTLIPEHPLYEMVKQHTFDGFYESEVTLRELCQCPPFVRQSVIYLTGKFQQTVEEESQKVAGMINHLIEKAFPDCQLLGPKPAMIEKRVNKFTWCLLLKSNNRNQLHNCLKTVQSNVKLHYSIQMKCDIDPYFFM